MKGIKVIGWNKVINYLIFGIVARIIDWCFVPQGRAVLLRLAGAKVGSETIILKVQYSNLYHYGFTKFSIGNRCFIGDGVMLDLRGGIRMDDDVTVSNRCHIITHINVGYSSHPLQKWYPTKESNVTISKGVYIGSDAVILPGVKIGQESVVGAGAVVTRDIPAHCVAVGVPARVIKKLRHNGSSK